MVLITFDSIASASILEVRGDAYQTTYTSRLLVLNSCLNLHPLQ